MSQSTISEKFDDIEKSISSMNSFKAARTASRSFFTDCFINSNEEIQRIFFSELFRWAQEKLHSRRIEDRLAALVGFSYYVDIEEDQNQLILIVQNLERILPLEVVLLIDGIAHLVKRIARLITSPIIPKLFERCISWLTARATRSAVLSSIFLMHRLFSFDSSFIQRYWSELNTVVLAALKLESNKIQKVAVELFQKSLEYSPNGNQIVESQITSILYSEKDYIPRYLLLLESFLRNNIDVCIEKVNDIFTILTSFLISDQTNNYLHVLVTLCETMNEKAREMSDMILSVFQKNSSIDFNDINVCLIYSEIMKIMPKSLSIYASKILENLNSLDCFFILSKNIIECYPDLINIELSFEKMKNAESSKYSPVFIGSFLKTFPFTTFKVVSIFTPKLNISPEFTLNFILNIFFVNQFPIEQSWEYSYKCFNEGDENIKILSIRSLFTILQRFNTEKQRELLFPLIFSTQSCVSSKLKISICDNIADNLLLLVSERSLFFIIEQLYEDEDISVRIAALNLISRIRTVNPLSALNFFQTKFQQFPIVYFQIPSKFDRMTQLSLFPQLIKASGEFASSHSSNLLKFILSILDYHNETPVSIQNIVIEKSDQKYEQKIRIYALKSIKALSQEKRFLNDELCHAIDSVISQLFIYKKSEIHLVALNTLRTIFRKFSILKSISSKKLVKLHQSLYLFLRNSTDSHVNSSVLRLLGTIGALDPHQFHTPTNHTSIEDSYPLFDKTKRERSSLHYVMEYILHQAKEYGGKPYELSVLINAITYIFQSDASKCLIYLESVVKLIKSLHTKLEIITTCDLFHFLTTIILVVDIAILPHKEDIYQMVLPYLHKNPSIDAIKLLCALIFAIKGNFAEYGPSTFTLIYDLIQDEEDSNIATNYLLALTLIVIYADGSERLYFKLIQKYAIKNDIISEFAINFLCQALRNCSLPEIILPSFHLACDILNNQNFYHLQTISIQLIQLLIIRFPSTMFSLPINLSLIHPEISELIDELSHNTNFSVSDFLRQFDAVPDPYPIRSKPSIQPSSLSHVFSRGRLQSSVSENDWSSWLLQITQELVLCSNTPAIRASHPLLRVSSDFERGLFPFVIVSVWSIAPEEDREMLSKYLLDIVHNSQTPPDILEVIVSACEAMDRAQFSLFNDPMIAAQISERCNSWHCALRFYEKSNNSDAIPHLLAIQSLLKRKECVLGLLSIAKSPDTDCELLEALSMWKQARDIYWQKYNETNRNETYLAKYLLCSMLMEDWNSINERMNDFKNYSRDMQCKVAVCFAAAARNTGMNAHDFLLSIRTDDPNTCIWRTLVALDLNQLETAEQWIKRGLSLLSNDMSSFLSGTYEPSIPSIYKAMMFEELRDITYQRKGFVSSSEILSIWKSKADYINRDSTQLGYIHKIRELLHCDKKEKFEIDFEYVNSLRRSQEWDLFNNSFKELSNKYHENKIDILMAKYNFDRQISNDFTEFYKIIDNLKKGEDFCDAVCACANRSPINPELIPLLNKVISSQQSRVRAWKHWSFFNLGCAQNEKNDEKSRVTYASNAIHGFAKLISLTRPSLHLLCHLCNLFFTFGPHLTNFGDAAENLTSLSPSSVIQIIPQLMVQFDNENESVRNVVYTIVRNFAVKHFQALAMPLCLVKRTSTPSKTLLDFITQMAGEHQEIMKDAESFTSGMLKIAITPIEEIIVLLEKALILADSDKYDSEILQIYKQIFDLLNSSQSSFVRNYLKNTKMDGFYTKLRNIFGKNNESTPSSKVVLINNSNPIKTFLQIKMEGLSTIDIAEIGLSSIDRPFSLAIPGFYSVDKVPATIQSISHVMKLIPSAKRPRKLRITGSDGRNYKYLLKGREDLRLDQRVMQLFSLANSILHDDKFGVEKHLHIRQVPIVPIAPIAGLIVWAEGGETLYSMISWHRKIVGIVGNEEQRILREYIGQKQNGNENNKYQNGEKEMTLRLNLIQKLELHRTICRCHPDDCIREALWLLSPNSEAWLNQTTNFARSNGLMSIIGYIVGIGDRHPSNILVMKGTGNVVHIDFSDCFEKASLRPYVHETVPFRLTRMIVRALGSSGVNGVFSMTAEYVMKLMRRNKDALLAFLDIFVQDPITDTIWYKNAVDIPKYDGEPGAKGSMLKRAIGRVNDKLTGIEFDGVKMNEHEQVTKLIKMATDEMNLAQMYYGWAPFW